MNYQHYFFRHPSEAFSLGYAHLLRDGIVQAHQLSWGPKDELPFYVFWLGMAYLHPDDVESFSFYSKSKIETSFFQDVEFFHLSPSSQDMDIHSLYFKCPASLIAKCLLSFKSRPDYQQSSTSKYSKTTLCQSSHHELQKMHCPQLDSAKLPNGLYRIGTRLFENADGYQSGGKFDILHGNDSRSSSSLEGINQILLSIKM